jgi:hypothetical protein
LSTPRRSERGAQHRVGAQKQNIGVSKQVQRCNFPYMKFRRFAFGLEWARDPRVRGEKTLVYCSGENSS